MPRGDGTGPFGFGPATGRGRGGCGRFSYMIRPGFLPRRMRLIGSLVPVAAAVIRDLGNANGLLRSFARKMLPQKTTEYGKPVKTSYTVVDEGEKNSIQNHRANEI